MIKCKSNKCLLIHVCSPNLIPFCLFMRLLGGWGLPRAGCRAGAGVIRGYGFTRRAQTHPSGKAAAPGGRGPVPALRGARMPAQGAARLRTAGPAHPPPPVPTPRTAPRTPLLPGCLPKAWRGERPQRVFSLIFTAGHLKNSLAIPRLALFVSSEFFFSFYFFFFGRGEASKLYFSNFTLRSRQCALQVFSLN